VAVRKSVDDDIVVAGRREQWLDACQSALEAQKFTNVEVSAALFQIRANYKKATVWGDVELTLLPEGDGSTRIKAKATANVDNIFAAFSSPGRKIIDRFKDGIRSTELDPTDAAAPPIPESAGAPSVADQIR
jgi:hypothetical protein